MARTKQLKLKPCPFCKYTQWAILQTEDAATFNIICLGCLACGPDSDTIREAKDNWNNRP